MPVSYTHLDVYKRQGLGELFDICLGTVEEIAGNEDGGGLLRGEGANNPANEGQIAHVAEVRVTH